MARIVGSSDAEDEEGSEVATAGGSVSGAGGQAVASAPGPLVYWERAMALKAEGSRADGSEEDVCFICYEASPPPIQSGCACRGEGPETTRITCTVSMGTRKYGTSFQ